MENKDTGDKVVVRYSSYTQAQRRATQKYRENNRDKVNLQRKKYYQERKEKDPDFLAYKRTKAKEYYQRKKAANAADHDDEAVPDTLLDVPRHIEMVEMVVDPEPNVEVAENALPILNDNVVDLGPIIELKPKKTKKSKKPEVVFEVITALTQEPAKVEEPVVEVDNSSLRNAAKKSKVKSTRIIKEEIILEPFSEVIVREIEVVVDDKPKKKRNKSTWHEQ
jgi:hypothetical protein